MLTKPTTASADNKWQADTSPKSGKHVQSDKFSRLLPSTQTDYAVFMETPPPTIEELFPHLSAEQLSQAAENLDQYLKLVLRIFERLESNPQSVALTPDNGTLPCTPPRSASSE